MSNTCNEHQQAECFVCALAAEDNELLSYWQKNLPQYDLYQHNLDRWEKMADHASIRAAISNVASRARRGRISDDRHAANAVTAVLKRYAEVRAGVTPSVNEIAIVRFDENGRTL
jgi:hypothetical protein